MSVLITGHPGFIGAVMVPLVKKAGNKVIGLYDGGDFGHPTAPISEIRADLRHMDGSLLKRLDAVIHLAALSNDPFDAQLTYDINHLAKVSSSCSNYGAAGDTVLDKNSPLNPVTPHGVLKVRAQGNLLKLVSERFSPVLLRSATAYGASLRLRCDILNNLTDHAVATRMVPTTNDGMPWQPIVQGEDICRAFIAVLEAPSDAIHAEAFNVKRPRKAIACVSWRRSLAIRCRVASLSSLEVLRPIRAIIRSMARRLRARCRNLLRSGRRAELPLNLTWRTAITAFPGGYRRLPLPPSRPDHSSPLGRRLGWRPAPQGRVDRSQGIRRTNRSVREFRNNPLHHENLADA